MELKIKPYHKNNYSYGGILIKNVSVAVWIKEIQTLGYSLKELAIYPIPNTVANSVWGCFIIPVSKINKEHIGQHQLCQQVNSNLFIPEKSILYPNVSSIELEKIFTVNKHIMHPEFGMVELTEPIDINTMLVEPVYKSFIVTKPKPSVFIPKQVKSFQINPLSQEEVMKNLEEKVFPKKEKMPDEPLNILEKGKLALYKLLFKKSSNGNAASSYDSNPGIFSGIFAAIGRLGGKAFSNMFEKMEQDLEKLEERNKKQLDKLMDMLKKNPEDALKYAIPLDEGGTGRGGEITAGLFTLAARWFNFSLFGSPSHNGSGSINLGDNYYELQKQYNETAEALIARKEYHKAAFVYFKLLKNHYKAAETLELGKFYQEAAMIHLKHTNQKVKAAECYEKGNMTVEAINIYKELNMNEKSGDLYIAIHKRKEADIYYEKVIADYTSTHQFVKASLIYKNKMNNETGGQSILLEGWKTNKDAVNCLSNYFSSIHDTKELYNEINFIYEKEVTEINSENFLKVLKNEYKKENELAEPIKEIAYEIIAQQIKQNPSIVSELKNFNQNNKELIKDTLRYNLNNKFKN